MSALARPVLGHLDPVLLGVMDDLRARLARVFRAPDGSRVFAVSGTGTSAMETAVANLIEPGKKALVVVTGYFGLRLAEIARRYGAEVRTVECEWGRAIDPAAVESAFAAFPADVLAIVHAETSTGVRNPVGEVAALAHARGALVIADCVTSLGGQEVDMAGWGLDVVYSGAQKCLGAPSGLAPIAFAPSALAQAGGVPQLLFRRGAARRLLGRPQVPPHDLLAVGIRVSRGAGRDRGRRPRGTMGAPRARTRGLCRRRRPISDCRSSCRPTSA